MGAGVRRGRGGAAEDILDGGGRDGFEFDAEEVRGELAEVGDAVALDHAGRDAEGSGVGGRTGDGEGRGRRVVDADGAGVVEVDEDGGVGGVIVHGHELVGTVVDAHDEEVVVVEDGPVVCGEGGLGECGGGDEEDECEG